MSVRVSGVGAVCAAGVGIPALSAALRAGVPTLTTGVEGLPPQLPVAALPAHDSLEVLAALELPAALHQRAKRALHRMDGAQSSTLLAALEAWVDAGLHTRAQQLDPARCALVIGGHNLAQQRSWAAAERYADKLARVPPSHALTHLDSYHLGSISEVLEIRGEGTVAGAASASGSVALIQAMRLLRAGVADRCVVAAPPCMLSPLELHALDSLGVLARPGSPAALRYQPFDVGSAGLVYGQASAALVLERVDTDAADGPDAIEVLGGAIGLDGTRKPAPSVSGELAVMRRALADAGRSAEAIDYINPHASGSRAGDNTEADALTQLLGARLEHAWINTTKAIVGHCTSSAGAIELVACVVQLREGFIHPTTPGHSPLVPGWRWPGPRPVSARPRCVLKNGFAFGGINTAIVLGRAERDRSVSDARRN